MDNVTGALEAAAMAEVIQKGIREYAAPAIAEALKPYLEKGAKFQEIAEGITKLESDKKQLNPEQKKNGFARFVRALALGKGNRDRSLYEAKQHWGDGDYVVESLKKALTAADPAGAGRLIPAEYSAEFVELLRGRTVVRRLARTLPMPAGNLSMRKQTAAGTAYYVGESSNVTSSQQTVGDINFSFKKLVALTPVSNSLLRMAAPEADAFVREDLLQIMALREDAAFLTDDGTSNTPVGIFNQIDAANIFADAGTTFAQQIGDYTKAIKLVEEANVPVDDENGHWILAPRVFWGIYKTAGATEDATLPFAPGFNLPEPRLLGYRVHKSTQAKKITNAGADLAATADRIYFVHAPSLIIADSLDLKVDSFDGAAYYDGSNVVSGVSRDETVIRVISEHDFAMRYGLAGSVITGVSVGN
jgi:HK97 family phage major capsid protein